jgi:hypothetical protein
MTVTCRQVLPTRRTPLSTCTAFQTPLMSAGSTGVCLTTMPTLSSRLVRRNDKYCRAALAKRDGICSSKAPVSELGVCLGTYSDSGGYVFVVASGMVVPRRVFTPVNVISFGWKVKLVLKLMLPLHSTFLVVDLLADSAASLDGQVDRTFPHSFISLVDRRLCCLLFLSTCCLHIFSMMLHLLRSLRST